MRDWFVYWFVDLPLGKLEEASLVLEHEVRCLFGKERGRHKPSDAD